MYSMMLFLLVVLASPPAPYAVHGASSKLTEAFKWKEIDITFPNESICNNLVESGMYIPSANSILGIEVWRGKVFLTVPRWYAGVGSSLNVVTLGTYNVSPPLIPYPDYEFNDIYNGNLDETVISASRIYIDECNRLWVPDNGQEGIFTSSPTVLASQKILVFDLLTNKLLRSITIGDGVKEKGSLFYEILVDINKDCNKAFAYVADTNGHGMLVYNWDTDNLTRITNSYMYFEPQSSVFTEVTQFQDGLMGMALSAPDVNDDGFKSLRFHAFSSFNEYEVSTRVLQDPMLAMNFTNFKLLGSRGVKGQSTTQRLDKTTGVLFYTLVLQNAIGCWNSKLYPEEYTTATNGIAAADRNRLTFPSALTLDRNRNIWVVSNNLLNFGSDNFNSSDYNYFVLFAPTSSLVKDTVCDTDISD